MAISCESYEDLLTLRFDVPLSKDQLAALGEHLRTCKTHRPALIRMQCEVVEATLAAGDELPNVARATIREHVEGCAVCAADSRVLTLQRDGKLAVKTVDRPGLSD